MLQRERFAWAWLTGLVVVPSSYFFAVLAQPGLEQGGFLPRLGLLASALVALAAIALLARFSSLGSTEATPMHIDERDQQIESASVAAAYRVLMGGLIVVGFVMPFSASRWELVDAAFFAIVLAEIVHHGLILRGYRRGLNG
jgi:hypothetical protein